jgi:hypothetical protein
MISTAKRCSEKLALRYVEGLVPVKVQKAPSFGSLFHSLMRNLWLKGDDHSPTDVVLRWREEILADAKEQADKTQRFLGIKDDSILASAEVKAAEISIDVLKLFKYYRDNTWKAERDRYRPVFVEQTFNVPMLTRSQARHPYWRLSGKWDLVLEDLADGSTIERDYKTTVRQPTDMAMMLELDTQPIFYQYAAKYLKLFPNAHKLDAPQWPAELPAIEGHELEIIRKKVPQEPPPLKRGGLSKAQNIDTTPELFRQAIDRHGLDPADYADVLDRLEKRTSAFQYRHRVSVGPQEIERWMHETRLVLEDVRRVQLHRDRAYRTDPGACQNQYGRRCTYHSICYGDAAIARADFTVKPVHMELEDEGDDE